MDDSLEELKKMWFDPSMKEGEKSGGLFGGGFDLMKDFSQKIAGTLIPSLATTGNNSNSSTINIYGATDPIATGQQVERVIQKQNQNTYNQGTGPKKEK